MKISRFRVTAIAALLATSGILSGCASHSIHTQSLAVQQAIAAALARSDLDEYTKKGCLNSLKLWGPAGEPAYDSPDGLVSGMFFLGDSYLAYDFVLLSNKDGQPLFTQQSQDAEKQMRITASELGDLTVLISASRHDAPPQQPARELHTTCIVFLDFIGNYFVANSDEASNSNRPTDRAIALADRLGQVAP